jgi:hypothetical protein
MPDQNAFVEQDYIALVNIEFAESQIKAQNRHMWRFCAGGGLHAMHGMQGHASLDIFFGCSDEHVASQ